MISEPRRARVLFSGPLLKHKRAHEEERAKLKAAGRELRLVDEAEHAAALAQAAEQLQSERPPARPCAVSHPIRPRMGAIRNLRERAVELIRQVAYTPVELSERLYKCRSSREDQRVYKLLDALKQDGLVFKWNGRYYLSDYTCPHCGQKVKGDGG